MANVINRTTLVFLTSVNDPEYADPPWLVVPPGSENEAVIAAVPTQYRKIAGDVISEMTQAEKDAVDAATVAAIRDDVAGRLDELEDITRALESYGKNSIPLYVIYGKDSRREPLILPEIITPRIDELNGRASTWNAILDAANASSNYSAFRSAVGSIPNYPQRTIAQMKTGVRNKLGT